MTKPSTPALTPAERASIPALQDEHNQKEVDSQTAENLRQAAQARKEAKK